MNLLDHPQTIDLQKRLSASDEGCLPVQIFMPAQGSMQGALRQSEVPGLFILTSNVDAAGQKGMMNFYFTADKPIWIIHPDLTKEPGVSRIIQ